MLGRYRVHPTLPAADMARARRFYEDVLGFEPSAELPGGVMYGAGEGSRFLVFPSSGKPSGDHTQVGITVDDLPTTVRELESRGVTFEDYDFPQFDRATHVATFPANRSAWFKDTEGNLLGIVQFVGQG
ncbi:MAG TPA: VOC family protein [Candidatus Limnocylindrales bacterium]